MILVRTYPTEREVDLENMACDDVDIRDVAWNLSKQPRYNGGTRSQYYIAQHSCLVASLCQPGFMLAGLLHDAAEYLMGDMLSQLKHHPQMEFFRELENDVLTVIYSKCGVENPPNFYRGNVKYAESIAWPVEEFLVGRGPKPKQMFVKGTLAYQYGTYLFRQEEAMSEFLAMYNWLHREKV